LTLTWFKKVHIGSNTNKKNDMGTFGTRNNTDSAPEYIIPKMHAGHIEVAVANLFGYRQNVIVPNVSWGLGLNHECDLLILNSKNKFTEVEIKISKADLKADFKKQHGHRSRYISRLYYAIPRELLESCKPLIPTECGIITVDHNYYTKKFQASIHRLPKQEKNVVPVTDEIIKKFYHLGLMRIWSLKETIYRKSLTNIK